MANWISKMRGARGAASSERRSALITRYDAYLQVLRANADVLELLSELEALAQAPGASGRQRCKAVVTRIGVQVYAMAKMLRVLGGPQYDALFPAIDRIRAELDGTLVEPPRVRDPGSWIVRAGDSRFTDAEVVGGKAANLGVMRAAGGVPVPEAVAVSVEAFHALLWQNRLDETVRLLSDALDPDEPAHLLETAERIGQQVLHATLPADLVSGLTAVAADLTARGGAGATFAVRSSATGEDAALSFAGQYTSVLYVPAEELVDAYLRVLAGFFSPRAMLMRLRRGFGSLELGMGALVMPMVEARVSGVAYSRDPMSQRPGAVVVEAVAGVATALVGGEAAPSAWWVDRATRSVVRDDRRAAPRDHAPISDDEVSSVAALAMRAEEVLGTAADIEWAIDTEGRLTLLQARPLALVPVAQTRRGAAVSGALLLVDRGVCASPGVGVGCVTRVRGRDEALLLPKGSVMVAVEASPDLALALSRAVALVAERGSVTGHLASSAREFGVPALMGVEGAAKALDDGALVTVDATTGRVYAGRVAELDALEPADPALVAGRRSPLLDRVLPLVLPLHLTDPGAPTFTPEHCRTVHDLVRFIHEKALLETVGVGDGSGGAWYRVSARLPFDLRLVPLEGGVTPDPGSRSVTRQQVTSLPAAAVLDGLLDPAVQRSGPAPIDAAGFVSVLSQSAFETDLGGPTWGIVSDRYLQLSSRIGYHFTTLEAFVAEREHESRVRFVFRGGAADEPRRARRARFIGRVLDGLGFQVTLKGDFVSGLFGQAPAASVCGVLTALGRLLVCANRLDMLLGEGALADWYAERFLAGDYQPLLRGERPSRPEASEGSGGQEV